MPTVVVKHTGSATEAAAVLRRRERGWLLAASVVVAFGLLLTYSSKTEPFDETRAQLEAGTLLDLNNVQSADAILPFLTRHYTDPKDRRFVAEHISEQIQQRQDAARFGRGKIPNVGTLNLLSVTAQEAE